MLGIQEKEKGNVTSSKSRSLLLKGYCLKYVVFFTFQDQLSRPGFHGNRSENTK